jgi:pyruvate/2-oxoglutarate dehydrogenase complex dihydrolipoamide dehydrogenase (E3) component
MTEKEARGKGLEVEIASLPMNKTSRGIETGNTKGIMKAVVDRKSGKILGAAILGEEGGEVMSVMEMAMRGGFTAMQIMDHVFAHPLYSESLNNLFMTLEK